MVAGMRRLVDRARAWSAGLPLRVKLIAALLVLVTLGLGATGAAGVVALRGYLVDKVDSQLYAISQSGQVRWPALSNSFFTLVAPANGATTEDLIAPPGSKQSAPHLPTMDQANVERLKGKPFTVRATGAGHAWRVLVRQVNAPETGAFVGSVTVAISLDDVDQTVARLIAIELVVGAVVLSVLAILGYTAIRSSLRPLVRVEATAAAIAAGDLTRRVPRLPVRTEVGRLAVALNGMLAQIETAFRDRESAAARARASEVRMRQFVADASHELRTPLTAVRGFAELLRQQARGSEPAGGQVLVAGDRIEQAAIRMGLLVEDMLLLARLDQQRPLEAAPVDLLALATDAVGEVKVAAPDHPVTLVAPPDTEGPPMVRGDQGKLRQVIGNLLSNAVQHTPPGTQVTVTVAISGGDAVLEVADDGPGLRPEDAERVFERFYRVDAARTRASGGTGLGLSIVDSIVAAHGGTVSVDSAPGEGARFRVSLPLLQH